MFILAFAGVITWVLNTEVTFFALSQIHDNSPILLIIAATLGSSLGFIVYYYLGKKGVKFSKRLKSKTNKIDVEKYKKSTDALLTSSFLISIPPCTAISVLSGMLKYNLKKFIPICLVGRIIRYTFFAIFFFGGKSYISGYTKYVLEYFK